jgi:hypothetical protein
MWPRFAAATRAQVTVRLSVSGTPLSQPTTWQVAIAMARRARPPEIKAFAPAVAADTAGGRFPARRVLRAPYGCFEMRAASCRGTVG